MRRLLITVLLALALTAPGAGAAVADAGFVLDRPLTGAVTRGFDTLASRYAAGHRGVDLAGRAGATVASAAAGRVYFAGSVAGVGTVSVDHGNGWRTTYQPVRATVAKGDVVGAGDPIGTLLAGHCATACLHWGLTDGVDHLDPLQYAATPTIRLLPHGAMPQTPPPLAAARVATVGSRPVAGRITSGFGTRRHPVTGVVKLHDGVDLAAACGTPVAAPADGVVVDASFHAAYGFRVRIDHGAGLQMAYTHLPGLEVREGQRVAAGERIGRVGSTGLSTGCHLHWMAWRDGDLIDPLTLGR